jgi:hypothetical protein
MKNEKERELDILNGIANDKKEMAIRGEALYREVDQKCHKIYEKLEKAMSNQH